MHHGPGGGEALRVLGLGERIEGADDDGPGAQVPKVRGIAFIADGDAAHDAYDIGGEGLLPADHACAGGGVVGVVVARGFPRAVLDAAYAAGTYASCHELVSTPDVTSAFFADHAN